MTHQSSNWNQHYRPKQIQQLHLNSVKTALEKLLTAPHFPQTLLFAGPKGTGKTSVARILGSLLNDPANEVAVRERFFDHQNKPTQPLREPDPQSPLASSIFSGQSFVVQELDAASNRGIDDIRALKERSALPPSQGLVTVYILDEVHMLTIEAFNALLKLLEEPPPHVVFILATTELHKLPETIVSRCHLVRFHKASPVELMVPLREIAQDQKLKLNDQILSLIAAMADGSFRDGVKLLQQYAVQGGAGEALQQLAGMQTDQQMAELVQAVVDKRADVVVSILEKLRYQGTDELYFLKQLIGFLHRSILQSLKVSEGTPPFSEKISRFLLSNLIHPDLQKPSPIPFLRLELMLLDLIDRAKSKHNSGQTQPPPDVSNRKEKAGSTSQTAQPTAAKRTKPSILLIEPEQSPAEMTSTSVSTSIPPEIPIINEDESNQPLGDGNALIEKWPEVVSKASSHNFGLAALLRSAQPIGGGEGEIVLRVYYSFHKEQLMQAKWRQIWDALTTELAGGQVRLDCVVEKLKPADLAKSTEFQQGVPLEALAVEALL